MVAAVFFLLSLLTLKVMSDGDAGCLTCYALWSPLISLLTRDAVFVCTKASFVVLMANRGVR